MTTDQQSGIAFRLYRLARAVALRVIPQPPPPITWTGDYSDWISAAKDCVGYDADVILARVLAASREVSAGKAAFERDGVAFAQPEYSWPLLAALLYAASDSPLHVLDIGGSLGSTYLQHRQFLDHLTDMRWRVVEQPTFARAGSAEFSTDVLTFSDGIDDKALSSSGVALFGSSLCYLEDPWSILTRLEASHVDYLLIDRTPFAAESGQSGEIRESGPLRHHIVKQTVYGTGDDGVISEDSYPCWVFSKALLSERLAQTYEPLAWWQSDLQPARDPIHWGCLWRRIR